MTARDLSRVPTPRLLDRLAELAEANPRAVERALARSTVQTMKQIALRLPTLILDRLDELAALLPKERPDLAALRSLTRSDVARLALLRGLDLLAQELQATRATSPGAGTANVAEAALETAPRPRPRKRK